MYLTDENETEMRPGVVDVMTDFDLIWFTSKLVGRYLIRNGRETCGDFFTKSYFGSVGVTERLFLL